MGALPVRTSDDSASRDRAARLARRARRDQKLAAGHILWVWAGLAWLTAISNHHSHGRVEYVILLGELSRLSLVIVVLLALYGARPVKTGAGWAHHAGWVLMECDVVLWGWYAAT